MTRSIFDPTGNDTEYERSNGNLGGEAVGHSHMPPGVQPPTSEEKSLEGNREAATTEEAVEGLEELEKMSPEEVDAEEERDVDDEGGSGE